MLRPLVIVLLVAAVVVGIALVPRSSGRREAIIPLPTCRIERGQLHCYGGA